MNDQIKQIAERLRGLRDVLELTAEDIARDLRDFSGRISPRGNGRLRHFSEYAAKNRT